MLPHMNREAHWPRVGNNKRWRHTLSGAQVWLPCDKQTFRAITSDGRELPTRFRSFDRAALAAIKG